MNRVTGIDCPSCPRTFNLFSLLGVFRFCNPYVGLGLPGNLIIILRLVF